MKRIGFYLLIAVWIVVATLTLTHLWLVYPDFLPQLPSALTLQLIDFYGATNGEELRDLETLTALAITFPVVLVTTLLSIFIWRQRRV